MGKPAKSLKVKPHQSYKCVLDLVLTHTEHTRHSSMGRGERFVGYNVVVCDAGRHKVPPFGDTSFYCIQYLCIKYNIRIRYE